MKQNANNFDQVNIGQREDRKIPKKIISNYKAAHETMQAGLKPPWVLFDTFMREADLIVTYKRYGKEFYKEISSICSKFEMAFADNDIDRMVELYGDLEAMKLKAVSLTV